VSCYLVKLQEHLSVTSVDDHYNVIC